LTNIKSDVAVVTISREIGDIINWSFKDKERKLEILTVEKI